MTEPYRSVIGARMLQAMLTRAVILETAVFAGLAAAFLGGCAADAPERRQVPIQLHQLTACSVSDNVLRTGFIELDAFGDFDASSTTSAVFGANTTGQVVDFPAQTAWLSAALGSATRGFWSSQAAHFGAAVDLLLWPRDRACLLVQTATGATYPALGGGQAFGYSRQRHLALVAGGDAGASSAVVGALTFSLDNGRVQQVDARARHVLLEPRAFSSATEFGSKLLVAGGEDPLSSAAPEARPVWRSAEVFDPELERFELDLLELRQARTRHAALLLADGSTLLIAGRGSNGDALATLEVVDPTTRSASLAGLATLEFGRIGPTAFTTADGSIVVLGGVDASQKPVTAIEWLTPDAAALARASVELPARWGTAFAPLPGGAVLAVGGCVPGASETDVIPPCRRGVPPEQWEGWWVAADGSIQAFPLDFPAPSPKLVGGEGGKPWLIATGAESVESAVSPVYRFDPWQSRFEQTALTLSGRALQGLIIDPGAFLTLGETAERAQLLGLRHSLRHEFIRDVALVLSADPDDARRPWHLVPDRQTGPQTLQYDGQLELTLGSVFVSDATFGDFRARVSISAGAPPAFILESPNFGRKTYGDRGCPWPKVAGNGPESVDVVRQGGLVVLERQGEQRSCAAPAGRAQLGIAAPDGGTSRVTRWDIERSLAPH